MTLLDTYYNNAHNNKRTAVLASVFPSVTKKARVIEEDLQWELDQLQPIGPNEWSIRPHATLTRNSASQFGLRVKDTCFSFFLHGYGFPPPTVHCHYPYIQVIVNNRIQKLWTAQSGLKELIGIVENVLDFHTLFDEDDMSGDYYGQTWDEPTLIQPDGMDTTGH